MAKFSIEEHQKRIRAVLTPTPKTSLIERMKAAALKRRK